MVCTVIIVQKSSVRISTFEASLSLLLYNCFFASILRDLPHGRGVRREQAGEHQVPAGAWPRAGWHCHQGHYN
jgi:hypothetical protein